MQGTKDHSYGTRQMWESFETWSCLDVCLCLTRQHDFVWIFVVRRPGQCTLRFFPSFHTPHKFLESKMGLWHRCWYRLIDFSCQIRFRATYMEFLRQSRSLNDQLSTPLIIPALDGKFHSSILPDSAGPVDLVAAPNE